MLRQPLVKTDSWLCCSQGRFATGRIFDVLGKVHDLGPDLRSIARTYGLEVGNVLCTWTVGPSNASTDAQLGTTVMGISAVLFHTAWTGAYESFETNPLIGAGLAHQFSDPQIGRSVVGELVVIRAFSGAYQWLNLAGFTINAELFESHFRFEGLAISCFCFSGSRFDSRSAEVPIQPLPFLGRPPEGGLELRSWHPNPALGPFGPRVESKIPTPRRMVAFGHMTSTSDLRSSAGLLSALWAAHIGFVSIPASCSQDPRPHLGENVLAFISKPVSFGTIVLTYNAGIDGLTQAFTFSDLAHHHLAIGSFLLLAGEAQRTRALLLGPPFLGRPYGRMQTLPFGQVVGTEGPTLFHLGPLWGLDPRIPSPKPYGQGLELVPALPSPRMVGP